MTADWQQVRTLFEQAQAQAPAGRRAFVLAAGADDAVRQEVLSLLAHADAAEDERLMTSGAVDAALHDEAPATAAPARIGAWVVTGRLGQGGMGEVMRARRADGAYEGEAAIKLLRRGMDSSALLARFGHEQRALARLNHPHIARLFDAGLTSDARPYFVMELVDGQPMDRACEGRPIEVRLALFLQLADAVAHAHRNLLVHRDLKPSNVLVDAQGQVKLLDFGIAKALDTSEGDAGLTQTGERPFTPRYGSPEQVRGEAVTTATDIYSLGVLLYQLLTGTQPTGRRAHSAVEVARSVLEEVPTRPSRLSAADTSDPQWERTRRRLEGDLDNIVLKALDKVPERRYPSADALAADVRAFLGGYPVGARAASPAYVALRFMQRNRWALLAAGLGGLGLVTGLVAAIVQGRAAVAVGALGMGAGLALALGQARSASRARDAAQARFEDLRQLAHAVLFDYHTLVEPLAGATPVRHRLVADAIHYLDRLAQAAPEDRRVRLEMGMAYHTVGLVQRNGFRRPHLGDTAGAMRSYERSIAILSHLVRQDARDEASAYELALALSARGGVFGEDHQLELAQRDLAQAAALFTRHLAHDTPDLRHRLELARTHLRRADVLRFSLRFDDAMVALDEARRTLASLAALQPGHKELPHVWVWVHNIESFMARERDDAAGVIDAEQKVWSLLAELHEQEPDNARYLEDLAGSAQWQLAAYGRLGRLDRVERWDAEAVSRWRHLARSDPDNQSARRAYLLTLALAGWSYVEAGAAERGCERMAALQGEADTMARRFGSHFDTRRRHAIFALTRALVEVASGRVAPAPAQVAIDALRRDFAQADTHEPLQLLEAALALAQVPLGREGERAAWVVQARAAMRSLGVR